MILGVGSGYTGDRGRKGLYKRYSNLSAVRERVDSASFNNVSSTKSETQNNVAVCKNSSHHGIFFEYLYGRFKFMRMVRSLNLYLRVD